MPLDPFDLNGSQFLIPYFLLLVGASVASARIPRWLRPRGHPQRVDETDALAYLADGAARLTDAVIIRLLATGALHLDDGWFSPQPGARGRTAAEAYVLTFTAPVPWSAIADELKIDADIVDHRLTAQGLLIEPGPHWVPRLLQILPYLLLFAFGATKWLIDIQHNRSIMVLTPLLMLTAYLAITRSRSLDRATRAGIDALKQAQDDADRLQRAPTAAEFERAVALFGTAVLIGSCWEDLHRLHIPRTNGDGDGSGGGCGGDSGGGDSGGGGCGGCGGCGGGD